VALRLREASARPQRSLWPHVRPAINRERQAVADIKRLSAGLDIAQVFPAAQHLAVHGLSRRALPRRRAPNRADGGAAEHARALDGILERRHRRLVFVPLPVLQGTALPDAQRHVAALGSVSEEGPTERPSPGSAEREHIM
jgi:hypothetical protein